MTQTQQENQEHAIPDGARLILVPIANPDTAGQLLRLAVRLAHNPESRVVALNVSLGDVEAEATALEALQPVLEDLKARGWKLKSRR